MSPFNCFTCGLPGHRASECPNAAYFVNAGAGGDDKPMWCGECDPRTRLRDAPDGTDRLARCRCHPDSRKLLPHHRVCPKCKVTTVAWDTAECGKHHIAGQPVEYAGPPRVPDAEWRRQNRLPDADVAVDLVPPQEIARRQAAESRAERAVIDGLVGEPVPVSDG